MKKLIAGLLLLGSLYSQDFFKFSTIYGAYSLTSPLTKDQTYQVSNGALQEIQEELEDHGSITFGIRKLARFGYENKSEVWYSGKEAPINESVAIGNIARGWEYVLEYSDHKEFGEEFNEQEYMIRYLHPNFIAKASYDYRGLEDLEFGSLDMRYRINKNNIDFSVGVAGRSHPAYLDFLPIDLWWDEQGIDTTEYIPFWLFAYDKGYTDEWTQQYTQYGYAYYDYLWWDEQGNLVATTDEEFYTLVYGEIVDEYNEDYARDLGYQHELSLSLGVDYYKYNPNNWVHFWATAYPFNKGMSDYSFNYDVVDNNIDYDLGMVLGWKLSKKFGVFFEARYLNMYNIQSYEAKSGFNWLIY